MPIKYIVLSESNHYGWVGGFTTLAEAKKNVENRNRNILYIQARS
jgi:hypothetical protein